MVRVVTKYVVGVLLLLAAVALVLYLQDPRFWNRYYLLLTNEGVLPAEGWADSEFQITGADTPLLKLADEPAWTLPRSALEDVDQYARERNSTSLQVWHRGQLLWRSFYQGYDEQTLIVGKSMSKMVVGVVVARAIKDGYIAGLDEPAANYIDEWQGTDKASITLRHLLHMAAGFEPFYTLSYNPFGNFMRAYVAGHNEATLIDGYELINEPGSTYDYSQAVSDLIGLVLERATGKPYGQYLAESLLRPIGARGGEVMMNRPEGLAHTGCCLLLPSESWLRIGILLSNSGVVNGEALFPEDWMTDYLAPSPANPAMGLHIWLGEPYLPSRSWSEVGKPTRFGIEHSAPYLASDLFLFDGSGHQVIYIVPSEQLVIVRTGGFTFGTPNSWDNAYIPNRLLQELIKSR